MVLTSNRLGRQVMVVRKIYNIDNVVEPTHTMYLIRHNEIYKYKIKVKRYVG